MGRNNSETAGNDPKTSSCRHDDNEAKQPINGAAHLNQKSSLTLEVGGPGSSASPNGGGVQNPKKRGQVRCLYSNLINAVASILNQLSHLDHTISITAFEQTHTVHLLVFFKSASNVSYDHTF